MKHNIILPVKPLPRFWIPISFFIAVGFVYIIAGAMVAKTVRRAEMSRHFSEELSLLNDAASIQGATYVIMLLLGLTGVILFIRAITARVKGRHSIENVIDEQKGSCE